ncbi:MAG: MMPL family transporter, partial [Mycobacterium sp.]
RSSYLHLSRRPESTQSPFWTRWVGGVMRRPWLSALAATALLLALAAPAFSMILGNSLQRQFEQTHEIRGGVNAAAEALGPGALGPVRVLVTFPDGNPASAAAKEPLLESIRQKMSQAPNTVSVTPPMFGNDYRSALLSAVPSVDPEAMSARDTVDWMREQLPPVADGRARIDVGGPTALIKDFDDRVAYTQPLVFGFVALIAFVMLLISIRSVFLAFKGVLMTVLSVAAAYGSLVVVFQWGWFSDLGFKQLSSLDSTIPPLVLALTFGLSMDYEIFLLTRIRERFLQTGNTRDAVAYGVSTSARTITSAALIMIAVFIGFAFAGMPLVAQLGVACAVAIAVDATVVRLVLVPALMAMFDEWNWWLPRWLDRILPSVDFEKPLPKADIGDLVIIPDDISALAPSGSDLRTVVKSAAKLKTLAPQSITVADPLAFSGCQPRKVLGSSRLNEGGEGQLTVAISNRAHGKTVAVRLPKHPVTMWRGRLDVALDALAVQAGTLDLEADALGARPPLERCSPMETTNVLLPTGDRLQIPTGAETLRLKSYLVMQRNSARDYNEFAELVTSMDTQTAAEVLSGIDRYYSCQPVRTQWVATQLVRRLAEPRPSDGAEAAASGSGAEAEWATVRQCCLTVAVAMLEDGR